ncbi:hypothetical protein PPERSA_12103 [Pseudocohnilembus persalinus]|uniref:Uncharacterized protein n=1 Tax=Pseudocohnilembus persalinus TaxID=266149 RepID=A0A0V0R933_PSEPJ|nr:hypothetical protein PPERSA_12103 [Pseudocohnilembus persalinus]|eukprot:KRX10979.1 hypothetical protein PPERSA_12103 [Pseudocohnilembus persalinus]
MYNDYEIQSDWCNASEEQCGQCDGTWCEEQPKTEGICYIDVCGCPDNWLNSWCDLEEAQFESEWCQENNLRCEQCGGYWCEGEQLVEAEFDGENQNNQDQDQNNQDNQDQDQDQEEAEGEENYSESGVCYIDVCGCPSDFLNDWCDVETAQFGSSWCQANSKNCEECLGYWCEGDDLVEDEKEEEHLCYISECGCPGNFQQDWCEASYNYLPNGYCQETEGKCLECQGVWCAVANDDEQEIDEDGEDEQTIGANINLFYAGFAIVLMVLNM